MPKSPKLGTLTIDHQEGPLTFKLERGGYFIRDGLITISIQTEAVDDEQSPSCAYFCLENAPFKHDLRAGDKFRCKGGMLADVEDVEEVEGPKAHAYFEFHAEEVDLTFTVIEVGKSSIQFALKATHDDVDYYDDRAKRTPTTGLFELKKKKPGEIWVPV
jgi:hypothetical protein